jgi:hypothetical protein
MLQMRRALHSPRRRHATAAAAGPQPLFETALVVPGLAATLFRAASAGVGLYCLLQWRTFRNTRKQVCNMLHSVYMRLYSLGAMSH